MTGPELQPPRQRGVHPEFHRHLLITCLLVILSFVLPDRWIQLSWLGFLYLTGLLALRLGDLPQFRYQGWGPFRSTNHLYRLLGLAAGLTQLIWLVNPGRLRVTGVPLLALFSAFIAWSMVRLVKVMGQEQRIDGRLLYGATAGYLLLGISGGLLLTVLDSLVPGGFTSSSGQPLTMPTDLHASGSSPILWDHSYFRLNYFAFVSLTTVGYGDITPALPITRLASLSLSVIGPLYIAVVLGVLISRLNAAGPAPPQFPAPAPTDRSPGGSERSAATPAPPADPAEPATPP